MELVHEEQWNKQNSSSLQKRRKHEWIVESEQEVIPTLSLQISELLWLKLAGLNLTC